MAELGATYGGGGPGSVLAEVSHPGEPGAVIGPIRTANGGAPSRPTHLREPAPLPH